MPSRPSANPRRNKPSFGSRTDIGCVREHNEDSLVVAQPLYAVADGMGGHAAGEVASEIAVRTLAEHIPEHIDLDELSAAVVKANEAVIAAAQKKGRAGMGTTLTAAMLEGRHLALAQVGDSRAYLLHKGKMQQLTRDHSLMADMIDAGEITPEEARFHPKRSVITRALGSDPDMLPDLYELHVSVGDRILLCSDGLSSMLEDDQIESLLIRTRDPQRAASLLVNEAIAAGGHDNITVVVIDVEDPDDKNTEGRPKARLLRALLVALAALALISALGFGAYSATQQSAYLGALNGKVAVYTGSPGTILGHELSQLDHITDIEIADLSPGIAKRLSEGPIVVDSLDAAEEVILEYRSTLKGQT